MFIGACLVLWWISVIVALITSAWELVQSVREYGHERSVADHIFSALTCEYEFLRRESLGLLHQSPLYVPFFFVLSFILVVFGRH